MDFYFKPPLRHLLELNWIFFCDSQRMFHQNWFRCVQGKFRRRAGRPTSQPRHWGTCFGTRAWSTGRLQLPLPWPSGSGGSPGSSDSSSESGWCWGNVDRMVRFSTHIQLPLVPFWRWFEQSLLKLKFTGWKKEDSKGRTTTQDSKWRDKNASRDVEMIRDWRDSIARIIWRADAFSSRYHTRSSCISELL